MGVWCDVCGDRITTPDGNLGSFRVTEDGGHNGASLFCGIKPSGGGQERPTSISATCNDCGELLAEAVTTAAMAKVVAILKRREAAKAAAEAAKAMREKGWEEHVASRPLSEEDRSHVLTWLRDKNGRGFSRCSEPRCEVNRPGEGGS